MDEAFVFAEQILNEFFFSGVFKDVPGIRDRLPFIPGARASLSRNRNDTLRGVQPEK